MVNILQLGGTLVNFVLQPWHLFFAILAGWFNQQQQKVIEYLLTENQILKEKLGKKRILLDDYQRRRLAVKGKVLGRRRLQEVGTLFTPDTILRWHRMLVAKKWEYSQRRNKPGRPPVTKEIKQLVLQLAQENPRWGYDRIRDALANLGYDISDQTVGNILKDHGIEPSGDREHKTSWKAFIKAHWDVLAAIDFTTVEVWTKGGLVTFYLLFVMELKTRRVHFAGCTTTPHEPWMKQAARELTNWEDGFLNKKRHLLMDCDTKFTESFREFLHNEEVTPVQLPPRSPDLNAHLERFFRSLKSECLDRMIFFGEKSLRRVIASYLEHYHQERNHQGLDGRLIEPGDEVGRDTGRIECRERLGGLLRCYRRQAA